MASSRSIADQPCDFLCCCLGSLCYGLDSDVQKARSNPDEDPTLRRDRICAIALRVLGLIVVLASVAALFTAVAIIGTHPLVALALLIAAIAGLILSLPCIMFGLCFSLLHNSLN